MNTYYRIGWSLALILAFIIGSATLVSAREPRHQERSSASYQSNHKNKKASVRESRHQERPAGSYRANHNNKNAAVRQLRHQKKQFRHARYVPARHVPVVVKDRRYFFRDGVFYRHGLQGYIAVQAPIGAVMVSLPIGSYTVVVAGTEYNVYGGVYYRHVPRGYEVVKRPYPRDEYRGTNKNYDIPEKVKVIPRALNVRQGPGKRHRVVQKVYRNDILKIVSRADAWVFVRLPYGEFGWVMSDYVAPMRPCAKG